MSGHRKAALCLSEMLKNANACHSIQYFRLPSPDVFVFFYIQGIFGHRINCANGYSMFCKKGDETMVEYRNRPTIKTYSTADNLLYFLPSAKARQEGKSRKAHPTFASF